MVLFFLKEYLAKAQKFIFFHRTFTKYRAFLENFKKTVFQNVEFGCQ